MATTLLGLFVLLASLGTATDEDDKKLAEELDRLLVVFQEGPTAEFEEPSLVSSWYLIQHDQLWNVLVQMRLRKSEVDPELLWRTIDLTCGVQELSSASVGGRGIGVWALQLLCDAKDGPPIERMKEAVRTTNFDEKPILVGEVYYFLCRFVDVERETLGVLYQHCNDRKVEEPLLKDEWSTANWFLDHALALHDARERFPQFLLTEQIRECLRFVGSIGLYQELIASSEDLQDYLVSIGWTGGFTRTDAPVYGEHLAPLRPTEWWHRQQLADLSRRYPQDVAEQLLELRSLDQLAEESIFPMDQFPDLGDRLRCYAADHLVHEDCRAAFHSMFDR